MNVLFATLAVSLLLTLKGYCTWPRRGKKHCFLL